MNRYTNDFFSMISILIQYLYSPPNWSSLWAIDVAHKDHLKQEMQKNPANIAISNSFLVVCFGE